MLCSQLLLNPSGQKDQLLQVEQLNYIGIIIIYGPIADGTPRCNSYSPK